MEDATKRLREGIRSIVRERSHIQREEKKAIASIKKLALKNKNSAAKILAKDVARLRNQVAFDFTNSMKCLS
jgi:predicted RecB family endonuclease